MRRCRCSEAAACLVSLPGSFASALRINPGAFMPTSRLIFFSPCPIRSIHTQDRHQYMVPIHLVTPHSMVVGAAQVLMSHDQKKPDKVSERYSTVELPAQRLRASTQPTTSSITLHAAAHPGCHHSAQIQCADSSTTGDSSRVQLRQSISRRLGPHNVWFGWWSVSLTDGQIV